MSLRFCRYALPLAIGLFASAASADFKYKTESELVAATMPSFVNIYTRGAETVPDNGPQIKDDVGSGFIIDPSGVIVTNRHVIEGAYSIYVTLHDGRNVPAKLIGKALTFDIALLKVDVGEPLPVAKMGDSDKLKLGDRVVALGNPWGFPSSASSGIVSAFHRNVGLSAYDDLIQTDATINQGNSGGPLFNMDGEVVGVNEAIYTRNQGGSIGIGFSIPINEAKFLVENVKKHGTPHIGYLGIVGQTVTPSISRALGRGDKGGGVIISSVVAGGSAERAGLKVGDVILKIDGQPIPSISALNRHIAVSVDKTLQMQLLRDGKETMQAVAILEWPKEVWTSKLGDFPDIGSVADLGLKLEAKPDNGGSVLVTSVEDKSIAWTAGFKVGDAIMKINARDVHTPDDLGQEVAALRKTGVTDAAILLSGPIGTRWVGLSVRE
jgi:serine protease Do